MKVSKRIKSNLEAIEKDRVYTAEEAIDLVKKTATTKFTGSVEVHLKTAIDAKKTDQAIRGAVTLPHGTGKTKKIAAFVTEGKEAEAKAAGAEIVGGEELIKKIKETEKTDFDVAVAEPAMMPKLATIAKILGTRGIMPNPKTGTVSENITTAIAEIAGGKVNFKNDNSGNVHQVIGKTDFDNTKILENLKKFMEALHGRCCDEILFHRTWLHRLTVNQVLMYFRKSQVKFEKLTSQGQLPVDDSPEAIHARKNFIDERMALVAAVGKLPDGYRNVFILHDIEGFEHNEVARILGCSEGTSKSQLFKARLSLRKLLRRKANPRVYKICHSAP